MEIILTASDTIQTLNEKFMVCFPYLKIQLFLKGHKKFTGSHSKFMFNDPQVKISEVVDCTFPIEIKFYKDMKTFEFEKLLEDKFGIHAQIMRKSSASYLVTSQTDDWSLDEQNTMGFEASKFKPEEDEKIDYREMD